jgi:hypothetical protein
MFNVNDLSKEGLLYVAIVLGGFGVDSFKEGAKAWGLIFLLVAAVLILIRLWLKSKGIIKKK